MTEDRGQNVGIGLKMMNHMLAQPLAAVWDAHKYWASFSIKEVIRPI